MADIVSAAKRLLEAAQSNADGDPEAHAKLRKELERISSLVDTPAEKIAKIRFQPLQKFALLIAVETGALQALARQDGSITTADLALETAADENLIDRALRVLSSINFCTEVSSQQYAANSTTIAMVQPSQIGGMYMYSDAMLPVIGKVSLIIKTPGLNQSPREGHPGPFEAVFGTTFFAWLDANPGYRTHYSNYLSGRRAGSLPQWFEVFPMVEEVAKGAVGSDGGVLLVDIGGNKGYEAIKFREAFPQLLDRIIVQDLEGMLNNVEEESKTKVEFMAYDFFTKQPILGSRFYFFRATLHNWNDEPAQNILANVAQAMKPGFSSLLIDDFVLPNTGASTQACSLDLAMMLLGTGLERTEKQWTALLDSAGLEIVKIWRTTIGYESVIEAKLKS